MRNDGDIAQMLNVRHDLLVLKSTGKSAAGTGRRWCPGLGEAGHYRGVRCVRVNNLSLSQNHGI